MLVNVSKTFVTVKNVLLCIISLKKIQKCIKKNCKQFVFLSSKMVAFVKHLIIFYCNELRKKFKQYLFAKKKIIRTTPEPPLRGRPFLFLLMQIRVLAHPDAVMQSIIIL